MIAEVYHICSIPALLIGAKSKKVFLFMHGLHGHKEEAFAFAKVAVSRDYQVLGIDVPVERRPWEVMPMLSEVRDYLYKHWPRVSIRANSIGAWFSLLTFQGKEVGQALFVSPILDMKKFIELMPQREEDYYEWVINHPITRWNAPTYILRPEVDMIVSEEVNRDFISQHLCQVTIMPDGERTVKTSGEGDIHKYSANAIEKVKIGRGNECPLKIETHMRAEVGFFQVEEVLIPKIQSSPAKSLLELYAGVEGEEMKRYM